MIINIFFKTLINQILCIKKKFQVWDLRQKGSVPIFSIKEAEDYISAMITNTDAKYLACASGDCLTTINIPERKLHVQVL